MNFKHEFGTVDLLVKSEFETRAIDSFTISLLKIERQLRKIFTYLIFQHSNFNENHIDVLIKTLSESSKMYLENFITGINLISPKTIEELYGETYNEDLIKLKKISKYRNKIFHGQLTGESLNREGILEYVEFMRNWSQNISTKFNEEINYCGFKRNSYQKSIAKIDLKNECEFSSIEKYSNFIKKIGRK